MAEPPGHGRDTVKRIFLRPGRSSVDGIKLGSLRSNRKNETESGRGSQWETTIEGAIFNRNLGNVSHAKLNGTADVLFNKKPVLE